MEIDHYIDRIDATIEKIKSSDRRPGVDEILLPGERSYRKKIDNRANGITIDTATLKELDIMCDELGVPNPL